MAGHGSQISTKAWDLSLYELHRKPHEMVSDSTAIAVSHRALHNELMCPICLDLMRNTQTTKECLHRFCQDCIITALRSGNKECPTCRKKLVSKRSLRPDPNFDALISKIYPDREELNAQQEKAVPRSRTQLTVPRRKRKAPESSASTPEPECLPLHHDKRQKTASPEAQDQTEGNSEPIAVPPPPSPSQPLPLQGQSLEEVELQLRPHPSDPTVSALPIRNLATYPIATVAHLVKYIAIDPLEKEKAKGPAAVRALTFEPSFDLRHGSNYSLFVQLDDSEYLVLPNGTNLKQICDNYWTPGDKLKLFFGVSDDLPTVSSS